MSDPQFGETSSPERLVVAEVSTAHPVDALLHAGQGLIVLLMEPVVKVVPPVLGDVVDHFNHHTVRSRVSWVGSRSMTRTAAIQSALIRWLDTNRAQIDAMRRGENWPSKSSVSRGGGGGGGGGGAIPWCAGSSSAPWRRRGGTEMVK